MMKLDMVTLPDLIQRNKTKYERIPLVEGI